jgi:hypothetical protein
MAPNANSYGDITSVVALTRIYLRGQTTYNSTTLPTRTQVDLFFDQVSGALNLALANKGFTTPLTQTDAVFACDMWVNGMVASLVEASQPTASFGSEDNPRSVLFARLGERADEWVAANQAGFAHLGVGQAASDSQGAFFTGQTAQSQRTDPLDTSLEQSLFTRRQFDFSSGADE